MIGCEPTGHYWFAFAKYVTDHKHKIVMVNPFSVKKIKELDDNSPKKTDAKDPKTIAKLVVDGMYSEPYMPEGIYAEIRDLVYSRDRIIKQHNISANRIQRWLAIHFPEYLGLYTRFDVSSGLAILEKAPLPEDIIALGVDGIRKIWHEKDYNKYFYVKETPKRGVSFKNKQDAINAARERYGFFVLISNEVKDPVTAIRLYRMRDIVEKAFWNIKERLNLKRTLTSSESALEGKFFVEFVALIYLSYIKNKMEEAGLFSRYTMHELLDELDVIECFKESGKAPIQGEVLKKQEQLYRDLGVKPLLASPDVLQ